MATLQVGSGQQYSTIAAAVNAAHDGDTVSVLAGTYTNDFVSIDKNLTLNAVGGLVTMNATVQAPNGKAILTEGAPGLTVNINGFAFTGATVPDRNGAGIRYEGGTLNLKNSYFGNNQNGILGAPDPNGVINIDHSEFDHNGVGGAGYTHNIYVGDIAQFTLTNSYTHDAVIGHEIKSRAANNTITNNRILDNTGSSSYGIDLPNGGNATITGNTIQKSANSQNPNMIAYGEEGMIFGSNSLNVSGNTIVNNRGSATGLWNAGGVTATFANNSVYGLGSGSLAKGPTTQSGTSMLASRPTLDTSPVSLTMPVPTPTPVPVATPVPALTSTPTPMPAPASAGLVISVAEDANLGNAKFTISVDGTQVGGAHTVTALHGAGQLQTIDVGSLARGSHTIDVSFINDAWGGTATADRNLYVAGATYSGQAVKGSTATLMRNGTASFSVIGDGAPAPVTAPIPASTPTPAPTHSTPVSTTGLVVTLAEDAYLGDAQFTITVDGKQVGGVRAATALHSAGESQTINVGTLTAGSHTVGISFINDAWGGTAATDRNLYVTGATYDGKAVAESTATLMRNGTAGFTVSSGATVTSTLAVNVSEDAYLGDAQFTIAVDGKQMGGIYTAAMSHSAGKSQAVTLTGITESFTPHDIAVTFLNDKWDGTAQTDRNLYVNSIQFDGQTMSAGSAALMHAGTQHFTTIAPANWAG
jgi:hypothetical protein